MFKLKPDYEKVRDRYVAWWDCQILDRPLVCIPFMKPQSEQVPVPRKEYGRLRDRWLDAEQFAAESLANLNNFVHYADCLPISIPRLGPEIFSAYYGCALEFGEQTAWSTPILKDWSAESLSDLQLDRNGFYFKKTVEALDRLIAVAKDTFIVGYPDLHVGGDAIAAFRDPQALCMDMIEHPLEIKTLCDRITDDFLQLYDEFYEKLAAAGMPSTTWLTAVCNGKLHVPSNDFSCMISQDMFEDVFLPGIIRECRHMDRCIYHLDGPNALRYLDLLLEIPEIHAIQWVPGAGNDDWRQWVPVYRRIQQAGKAFCLSFGADNLPDFFDAIPDPKGVWLTVWGARDQDSASALLKAVERWGK